MPRSRSPGSNSIDNGNPVDPDVPVRPGCSNPAIHPKCRRLAAARRTHEDECIPIPNRPGSFPSRQTTLPYSLRRFYEFLSRHGFAYLLTIPKLKPACKMLADESTHHDQWECNADGFNAAWRPLDAGFGGIPEKYFESSSRQG